MKLIKFKEGYIIVDDYNTKEDYDSRITAKKLFYKDELNDIVSAEYSPASRVSRPLIAITDNIKYYLKKFLDNTIVNELALIDFQEVTNYTGEVNVGKLADDYVSNHHDEEVRRMYGHHFRSFIEGFKKCQEINSERKFTLEDMHRAYNKGSNTSRAEYENNVPANIKPMTFNDFIKLIKKEQTEWDIHIEMQEEKLGTLTINPNCWDEHDVEQTGKLKPVINEHGFVKTINR